jgi:hypothetical protein
MKAFLEARGWKKYGRCGCKPPMDKYSHPAWGKYEIRITDAENTMHIRLRGSVIARAGQLNYKEVYEKTII